VLVNESKALPYACDKPASEGMPQVCLKPVFLELSSATISQVALKQDTHLKLICGQGRHTRPLMVSRPTHWRAAKPLISWKNAQCRKTLQISSQDRRFLVAPKGTQYGQPISIWVYIIWSVYICRG